jgi:hypothetical protein
VKGITRNLGYLKVTLDPANNTAIAQQIFVAWVVDDDSPETPQVYDPPFIYDTITFPLTPTSSPSSSGGGGNCFIATAAFGSYFDPCVKILRDFRDTFLVTSYVGQSFVNWYYKVSPPIADTIRTSKVIKAGVRIFLLPAVGFSYLCLNVGIVLTLGMLLLLAAMCWVGTRRLRMRG